MLNNIALFMCGIILWTMADTKKNETDLDLRMLILLLGKINT